MRGRDGALVLLLVGACGTQEAATTSDGGAFDDGAVDAAPDVTLDADLGAADATADGGGDTRDTGRADADADASRSFCVGLDAAIVLVCETFDDAGTLPLPFRAVTTIPATLEVTSERALSAPNSLRVAFGDPGDAGEFNSATGTVAQATFANAIPRARLEYAVFLDATFGGEVDTSALVWSGAGASYRVRFGLNGGAFWEFDSTGVGYSSQVAFPSGNWYRVEIEVDLTAKHLSITAGGAHILDVPIAPPAMTPTSLELDVGVAAVLSSASGPAPAVLVDDVLLTSF
jgi:hypothetical protein